MKKFISAACIAAALLSGYSIYHTSNKSEIDSVVLENIEALANDNGEGSSNKKTCYSTITSKDGCQVRYCQTCRFIDGTDTWYALAHEC